MSAWPWLFTAWACAAAAVLPLAAAFVPGLPLRLPLPPSAAWILLAAAALATWAMVPATRWLRLAALPALGAAGYAVVQAWAATPLTVPWSLGLCAVAAGLMQVARPVTQAVAQILAVLGFAGLALPLGGWSPDGWQQAAGIALGILVIESIGLAAMPRVQPPLALVIGQGPRRIRRWLLAARRLGGMHLGLRPLLIALPWVVGGALVLGFALSGVTAVRVAESGVLFHRGAPIAVLPAGMHIHAPWPWSHVVRVEQGVEHRLSLSGMLPPSVGGSPDAPSVQALDRQWHRSHGREVFFLTAADIGLGDRRGVRLAEIINADIVLHWRVATGDAAIIAAALRAEDPNQLLISLARRWVQQVFASETPSRLLGADRADLAERMRANLQAELLRLGTGLEVTAIACEAIHPPLAAAPAFLATQAAEREAVAAVAIAGIRRETLLAEARIQGTRTLTGATATAAEARSFAEVGQVETAAEALAWARAPEAIALERRIQAVTAGDSEGRTLTVIDHRVPMPIGLGIDLSAPMRPRHVR